MKVLKFSRDLWMLKIDLSTAKERMVVNVDLNQMHRICSINLIILLDAFLLQTVNQYKTIDTRIHFENQQYIIHLLLQPTTIQGQYNFHKNILYNLSSSYNKT